MTLFIWDQSHYDGPITADIMRRAKDEGIVGVTHKIGEGTGVDDPLDATALAASRTAGLEFIGGYHVVRSGAVSPQVDELLALANRDEPWWRDFPLWFWQVDLERWSYDNVPAATGIAFAKELRARTGRMVKLYASHGQYGDQLADWDGPLWNADYVGRSAAGFAAMYPGDTWQPLHTRSDGSTWRGGWAPYSGKAPVILQYTSSATIAGLTTCDANAFRGTLAELRALINGGDMTTQLDNIEGYTKNTHAGIFYGGPSCGIKPAGAANNSLVAKLDAQLSSDARVEAKLDALLTAIGALGSSNPDVAAILSGVNDQLNALEAKIEADTRDAIGDALEGGSGAVRADA